MAHGEPVCVRPGEDLGLGVGIDPAAQREPAVLLKLVCAAAQVADPQDDDLGVLFGQPSAVQQHATERYPRPEQPPVLSERGEQVEFGHAPDAGGQLAEQPPDRPSSRRLPDGMRGDATAGRGPGNPGRDQWSPQYPRIDASKPSPGFAILKQASLSSMVRVNRGFALSGPAHKPPGLSRRRTGGGSAR